jgi:hypothetical protein
MTFTIVWPERRIVSEAQIRLWYADAVANVELEDDARYYTGAADMAAALHRTGLITLAAEEG